MHVYSVKTEKNIYIIQSHDLRKVHDLVRKQEGADYNGFDFIRLGHINSDNEKIVNIIKRS